VERSKAMMISAMALVNRGEVAWIEDPGFTKLAERSALPGRLSCQDL